MSCKSVSVQAVAAGIGERDLFIDVRSPAEFESCHPAGAENLPLDRLNPGEYLKSRAPQGVGRVYLVCLSGTRAKMAQEKFSQAGYSETLVVEGGLNAWRAAGFPVIEGKEAISVERQARIVIGSLVVIGAVIGWTIHPVGFVLSALVGAGLVFAGITDTCAIASFLSRMPWNQGSTASASKCCSA